MTSLQKMIKKILDITHIADLYRKIHEEDVMNISASFSTATLYANYTALKVESSDKEGGRSFTLEMQEQSFSYSYASFEFQGGLGKDDFQVAHEEFQAFLEGIGYGGKPIAELSQDEAAALVSDEGLFGVSKTADRIADFVLSGAGDNEELLRAGRAGILQGFKEAEQLWGGKLPDISYQTIDKAVETIDKRMHELGLPIIKEEV